MLRPARALTHILATALLLSLGCSGDGNGPAEPGPNPVENATLSVSSAAIVSRVAVNGLPAPAQKVEVGDYEVILSAEGAEDVIIILAYDQEGWHFLAPLHSITPLLGGDYSVVITHGEEQSPAYTLTVGTLPEAPGAYAATIAALTEWVELVASGAGTSIAELKAMDPKEVDPGLLPLRLAQAYLDSDEDDHDLTDLVANSDGFLSAEATELFDRAFGYMDLEGFFRLLIEEMDPPEEAVTFNAKISPNGCIDPGLQINGAGELLSNAGDLAAGLGLLPGTGSLVGAGAGLSVAVLDATMGFLAGTRPSQFIAIDCDIDRTVFNEDFSHGATYSNVQVTAISNGFIADQSLANAFMNIAGGVISQTSRLQIMGSNFLRDLAILEVGQGANAVFGLTDIIEFCPQEWTINISDAPYQTAGVANRGFEVNTLTRTITPTEVGFDVLTVAVQPSLFGGRTISKQIELEVKAIEVTISPALIQLENPGFPVNLDGAIVNADDPRLAWLPERGGWIDALPDTAQGGASRTLSTPSNPDFYPFDVRVESVSRTGLRASGVPARFAVVRIELAGQPIEIGPAYACLQNGTTQQFSIVGESLDVSWELTDGEGSLDANGLYTAPVSGEGSATIRVSSVDDPSRVGYATVETATCDCWIDIQITGDSSWDHEDDRIAYSVQKYPEGWLYKFDIFAESGDDRSISATLWNAPNGLHPVPGGTGDFPIGFAYRTSDWSWQSFGATTLFVDKLTESYMHGSIIGSAVYYDEFGNVASTVNINVDFRALRYEMSGAYPCP